MTATYIALANYTVPSGTPTSITFSSIPATYRDLVLVIDGRGASGSESFYYCYFNSDTGANYSRVEMYGTGSTTASGTSSNLIPITLNATNTSTNLLNIMDYSATDKHKTVLYRNNAIGATAQVLAGAGRWASTNAINTIKLEGFSTAAFATGTTFALFGIVS